MRLIKTIGGQNGAPHECGRCASKDFVKSGIAWHCITCGNYHPTSLGFQSIKNHLEKAASLMKEIKRSREELERIVE